MGLPMEYFDDEESELDWSVEQGPQNPFPVRSTTGDRQQTNPGAQNEPSLPPYQPTLPAPDFDPGLSLPPGRSASAEYLGPFPADLWAPPLATGNDSTAYAPASPPRPTTNVTPSHVPTTPGFRPSSYGPQHEPLWPGYHTYPPDFGLLRYQPPFRPIVPNLRPITFDDFEDEYLSSDLDLLATSFPPAQPPAELPDSLEASLTRSLAILSRQAEGRGNIVSSTANSAEQSTISSGLHAPQEDTHYELAEPRWHRLDVRQQARSAIFALLAIHPRDRTPGVSNTVSVGGTIVEEADVIEAAIVIARRIVTEEPAWLDTLLPDGDL